jgi:hypothetical protein
MNLLARQIPATALEEGLPLQSSTHSLLVFIVLEHALFQNPSKEAGDTGFLLCGLKPSPAGNLGFKRNRDIPQCPHHA